MEDGIIHDKARVEVELIGPEWLRLLRYRFYMDHQPKDHLTVWKIYKISNIFGTYTPPGWFLKLIGQVKDE
jgi:hypothetical protein